jgi:subtilisin family serine protease
VAGGRNFAGGSDGDWQDGNGHGTHVAGSAAARDNGIGVVGVAPGAPVWAVKVCKNGGICMSGDIIAGIDWVAQQKASGVINFAAANFSISSSDSKDSCSSPANATHRAICGAVGAGVVFVMAGGNDARKKDAYPVAFSVAAIADFDGKAGAAGSPTCRSDEDDTLANFSNWAVDIAAPGTCILSTWNDGGYRTISGTSMAAPHVTGAVALYLHANGFSPATNSTGAASIKSSIVNAALAQSHDCGYTNERGSSEKLLFVNGPAFGGNGSCEVATGDGGDTPPEDPGDPGEPSGTMSVALAGSSSTQGRNFWRAHADATVSTESGAAVSNATVSGEWTDAGGSLIGSSACTTGSAGSCRVTLSKIPNSEASVTFNVTGVTHATLTWDGVAISVSIARPADASMR